MLPSIVMVRIGAWWSGPICFDGNPKWYAVYGGKRFELKWQYKGMVLDRY